VAEYNPDSERQQGNLRHDVQVEIPGLEAMRHFAEIVEAQWDKMLQERHSWHSFDT
jgi:hypothetical protein